MDVLDPLFAHVRGGGGGGLVEAHNALFEWYIWTYVCAVKLGWPELRLDQMRCSAAKARAHCLPGALGLLGDALGLAKRKDKAGDALIKFFSVPVNPTKSNGGAVRNRMADHPDRAAPFIDYCDTDVITEHEASTRIPDLCEQELRFWQYDLLSNARGVGIDIPAVDYCIAIMEQAFARYNSELALITAGIKASEIQQLTGWLLANGAGVTSLDAEHIESYLARDDLPPQCRRALEIRQLIGSASVKKLYAIRAQTADDGRLHDLTIYHGARTGRDTGTGPQPLNMPRNGPRLLWCECCSRPYYHRRPRCPWCDTDAAFAVERSWSVEAVDHAIRLMALGDLDLVEQFFGDALLTIAGCIRGLFIAAPGHQFISSDYTAIEAVVTAALAGEQWRLDAFARGDDIYLRSASRITGTSYDEYAAYRVEHGENHADRQKIGKPAELGLGFGGWIGAWRQFDKSGTLDDDAVRRLVLAWRDASPHIVEFWGGQVRNGQPERYGLEGAAVSVIGNPGTSITLGADRDVRVFSEADTMYIELPSGRRLTYHQARLDLGTRKRATDWQISYMSNNKNPAKGERGWTRIETYGGSLCENVVQATARDILRDAILRLADHHYPTVLRIYDEIVAEVPEGYGSVEELERLMGVMPSWAEGWPIRASGGWAGKRYRKE
jgi:DNA polymerase